ncbi:MULTISPECIES: bifunctional 4-hydroxy-2-oxoglutarate aldolase/2-dehydro-3-deoxy-phosphogluconate aldolase [Hydrocarboniphaga]|jgi:2-dehydro-3-deoxyphosphogluconate aldolase/(4S)-4-hydroxy-2-oxoglutarate aldolase|uniref:4-hydroxy-2-oxoglutarate aldolase/2-deydro-3-deoxyphosphogluconate aldolase n=1 Tax=Hydrocarboniphaga effusa AP103 TaxID=1172194 RepID=I8T318_9GAMM|nr:MULTISPECIES: bifunctional 4-hydroxy-2-oxoglutarate aldolase/2-dehydro-3-deoxy-phosphogluconate aldolase [Hydrocarboniphaga]EIT68083.1 4-hydroxy-2-oxoglutarate aldolase/2-deydro-3-deoxyphosphogluconate aldolase [Hydrocarboniphaga effusa AP103]MDZ4078115.1 bifunctional 4-hydroxy-2-oxoglutarate aldolase/2-dehydro-3-deoxy-phosphogluconate aldolase [Hydrocarboniphaga sp.]
MTIDEIFAAGPVIPVIVIQRLESAIGLARALVDGGVRVLEVTMRTPAALDAMRAMRDAVPEAIVGAGTITNPDDLSKAIAAGAQFGVSPGATPSLLSAIRDCGLPFLPGAMTPSDVMLRRDAGFTAMKLFPAQQAGGIGMLKALGSVFADVRFCPTGGIDAATAPQFLALPNVACVGGSWIVPNDLVAGERWSEISELARQASALRNP